MQPTRHNKYKVAKIILKPNIIRPWGTCGNSGNLFPLGHFLVDLEGVDYAHYIGFSPLLPYPSLLDFWKIKFEKSSATNWIFNLQKSISKLIFAGYTGSKNPVRSRRKIQFVELDFSNLIF